MHVKQLVPIRNGFRIQLPRVIDRTPIVAVHFTDHCKGDAHEPFNGRLVPKFFIWWNSTLANLSFSGAIRCDFANTSVHVVVIWYITSLVTRWRTFVITSVVYKSGYFYSPPLPLTRAGREVYRRFFRGGWFRAWKNSEFCAISRRLTILIVFLTLFRIICFSRSRGRSFSWRASLWSLAVTAVSAGLHQMSVDQQLVIRSNISVAE